MKVFLGTAPAAALIMITIFLSASTILADNAEDICQIFPNNTVVRDPDSCNRYIECINGASHFHDCPSSTPYYNKNSGCTKTLPLDSTCTVSCSNQTGLFIADPKSCKTYFFCFSDEFAIPGQCPELTHFNVTQQACIGAFESECRVHKLDICSIVKDGINSKDLHNCHKYYVCTKGKLTSKTCSAQYYDSLAGKCVSKALVDCPEHPLPKDVCGTKSKPKKDHFADDEATCRGYFYCRDIPGGPDTSPVWGQCGTNKFFNVAKQACDDPTQVVCGEDRCDGRTMPFVGSSRPGCRHYWRCLGGVAYGVEMNCGNSFFNETMGACVNSIVEDPYCKAKKSS